MSKPLGRESEAGTLHGLTVWSAAVYDDDDEADDETDFDDEDESSVRRLDWSTRPGFGSPEWWSGN
jgi:hypothetical protein